MTTEIRRGRLMTRVLIDISFYLLMIVMGSIGGLLFALGVVYGGVAAYLLAFCMIALWAHHS